MEEMRCVLTRCDGVMEIGRWWVGGEEVGAEGLREVEVDGEDGGVRAGGWRDGGNGGSLRVCERWKARAGRDSSDVRILPSMAILRAGRSGEIPELQSIRVHRQRK